MEDDVYSKYIHSAPKKDPSNISISKLLFNLFFFAVVFKCLYFSQPQSTLLKEILKSGFLKIVV